MRSPLEKFAGRTRRYRIARYEIENAAPKTKKKRTKRKKEGKKTGEKVVQPFETRFHPKAAISTTLSEEKPTALFKQGSRKSDSLGVSKKKKKESSVLARKVELPLFRGRREEKERHSGCV